MKDKGITSALALQPRTDPPRPAAARAA